MYIFFIIWIYYMLSLGLFNAQVIFLPEITWFKITNY